MDESARKSYNDGFIKAVFVSKHKDSDSNLVAKILLLFTAFLPSYLIYKMFRVKGLTYDYGVDVFTYEKEVDVTFDDVCGIDEAKMEIEEIVEYLRSPARYTRLGARLPKGVLLIGEPGTGKTLLARAVAGEANVPFFHAAGSEFDEVLVGQGAKRIRELFSRARKYAPCVVFIDEIDSIGSKRTSSSLHPYANQTINQLLSEMDGFTQNEGVIVIGATNKRDSLDAALTRPGRFDIEIKVARPDLSGREDIFQLYLDKIVHSSDCDINTLARGTTGFTGADIENMVNQAALKAATERSSRVTMKHLDEARDRILMGPARLKGLHADEEANRNTAYHEAGHTIVAIFTKHSDPIHKVTITPRGDSLGLTAHLPEKDHLQYTKGQLLAKLDVLMGGRVAEELIFGGNMVTTGSASDMRKATKIAERLVKTYGMSEQIGLRDFTSDEDEISGLGRGPNTNNLIDEEINRVLKESYERAKRLLIKHRNEHRLLAQGLLEYETLTKQEVERVIRGEKLKRPNAATIKQTGIRRKKQPQTTVGFITEAD
ncbi:AAA domain-containing protein [Meloidogyne graminicola]|uniref:AAA domain-containing protein n=1 Tax=Meloidogyne graminicola TaxID=189291 RepID=A0A8S9ZZW6_9BILA|nr:AAA domain-containing protein [Meloidogyne graminicola]